LTAWNGLRGSRIRAGQSLIVRAAGSGSKSASAEPRTEREAEESVQVASRRPTPSGSTEYQIRPGDSLIEIAQRFDVSVGDLRAWNGLRSNRINAGQTLTIQGQSASPVASAGSDEPERRAEAPRPTAAASSNATEYKIRRGDSLAAIASKFGVTIGDLQASNGLRGSNITAGDTLVVPSAASSASNSFAGKQPSYASAALTGGSTQRYQIRRGDTLAVIASRFGVTVRQLMDWNGLRNTRITAGQYLLVRETVQGGG
jgi:LysM repeat protein